MSTDGYNVYVRPFKKRVRRIPPTPAAVIKFVDQLAVANCTNPWCPLGFQPLDQFEPADGNTGHKKRADYLETLSELAAIGDVPNDPEATTLLYRAGFLRVKHCLHCRLIREKTREKAQHGRRGPKFPLSGHP